MALECGGGGGTVRFGACVRKIILCYFSNNREMQVQNVLHDRKICLKWTMHIDDECLKSKHHRQETQAEYVSKTWFLVRPKALAKRKEYDRIKFLLYY